MATLSLEARENECGAESLAAAASLQSLASILLATGRAAAAEALCQRCLKIRCLTLFHARHDCQPIYSMFLQALSHSAFDLIKL